jgi:hypothetical protein
MTGHAPREVPTDTIKVTCAESGAVVGGGPEGQDVPCTTLADLEAFCTRLRELRAQDDLLLDNNGATFTVTLDLAK